jgi:hypothetical protein
MNEANDLKTHLLSIVSPAGDLALNMSFLVNTSIQTLRKHKELNTSSQAKIVTCRKSAQSIMDESWRRQR